MTASQLHKRINDQIGMEFGAAYSYLAMSAYFEGKNLPGFAHWMRMQYKEEIEHAERFVDYLLERGQKLQLPAVSKPTSDFKSPLDVVKRALANERKVTASINKLYELANEEKDYPAQLMLHWFIDEQVEEESSFEILVGKLQMAGDDGATLLAIDRDLGSRAPSSNSPESGA